MTKDAAKCSGEACPRQVSPRLLIIRPGAIGDTLLTFPILQAVRQLYPNPHITFVSNAHVLPLAQAFGLVEETSDYLDPRWSALFSERESGRDPSNSLGNLLQTIDLAICWLRDPDGIVERNVRAAGVKHIIIAPGRPPEGERIHIVQYLAHTIGLEDMIPDNIAPISATQSDHQGHTTMGARSLYMVGATLAVALGGGAGGGVGDGLGIGGLVAIHPGSGGAQKCWPIAKFAAVIQQLAQRHIPVLLLTGPADTERLNTLRGLLTPTSKPNLLKILDNAPLLEVAQHLQQCACYLGNDSGITHLAALLGVPTIALFGPSDPAIWRPLGPHVQILPAHPLEQLPVAVAMEAIAASCAFGRPEL